jgi:hypothetical protein
VSRNQIISIRSSVSDIGSDQKVYVKNLAKAKPEAYYWQFNLIHFRPSLIFVAKARSLPQEWNPLKGSALEGSSLAWKYQTRVEVGNTIAYYDMVSITNVKCFIVKATETNCIKVITAVIYAYL